MGGGGGWGGCHFILTGWLAVALAVTYLLSAAAYFVGLWVHYRPYFRGAYLYAGEDVLLRQRTQTATGPTVVIVVAPLLLPLFFALASFLLLLLCCFLVCVCLTLLTLAVLQRSPTCLRACCFWPVKRSTLRRSLRHRRTSARIDQVEWTLDQHERTRAVMCIVLCAAAYFWCLCCMRWLPCLAA
jgi:hypothetical protein